MGGAACSCVSKLNRRARSLEESTLTSRPITLMLPFQGLQMPLASLSSDDLPQPLGPMMLVTLPCASSRSSPAEQGALAVAKADVAQLHANH